MKHTYPVTLALVLLFFAAQIIGLFISSQYLKGTTLPLNIERPEVEESQSYLPIVFAIIISTVIALILIKFRFIFIKSLVFRFRR